MTEPCRANSLAWSMSDQFCRACGHTGFMHPGGGGNNLACCLICSVQQLEAALLTREHDLTHELDRVDRLIAYIGDRWAMPRYNPPPLRIPTLSGEDVIIP